MLATSVSTPDQRAAVFLQAVTYLRAALVPVIMTLVLVGDTTLYAYAIAGGLFALAAVTDFFDGFLARRWAQATTLGSFLDTTADKLLVAGALVALVAVDRASPWVAFIIIARELIILGLRGAVAADGSLIKPSIWGKLKANIQFLAIFLAIVRFPQRIGPLYLDEYAMIAAAAVTVASGAEYVNRFSGVFSRSRERR
jgi:CDP-diacylglycerol---glycerol-3-phosphate 3-phosphatidyltransferase